MSTAITRWMVGLALLLGSATACSLGLFTDEPADGADEVNDTHGEAADADARDDATGPDGADDSADVETPGDDGEDDDGFEVSPTCGNGTVESGEDCDDRNLTAGDGCESNCLFTCHSGADCADANDCTVDLCVPGGNGRICTNDFATSGADCDDANPCTTGETCNATGSCEGGAAALPETVCRAAVDLCDAEETCGGASACPDDALEPSGHVCRAARLGAECDYAETCSGSSVRCPADIAIPDGGPCGRGAGVCCAGVCHDPGNCCTNDHCRCSGRTREGCSTFRTRTDCLSHLPCAWDTAMSLCYGYHLCNAYAGGTTCTGVPDCTVFGSLRLCTGHSCAAL